MTGSNTRFQSADLARVAAKASAADDGYVGEVLKSDLLSVGVYILAPGATDNQRPHGEDEVYYAVTGDATFKVGDEDHPVQAGSLLFVPAGVAHYFHDITEELVLVVFWAPPERSVQLQRDRD
jgi:mannose-6-phosphate isomerase-like protein (cupin superfamily)